MSNIRTWIQENSSWSTVINNLWMELKIIATANMPLNFRRLISYQKQTSSWNENNFKYKSPRCTKDYELKCMYLQLQQALWQRTLDQDPSLSCQLLFFNIYFTTYKRNTTTCISVFTIHFNLKTWWKNQPQLYISLAPHLSVKSRQSQ